LEYKSQQEQRRLDGLSVQAEQEQQRVDFLSERAEKKQKRIEKLDGEITVKTSAKATIVEIEAMGKPALLGGFNVTADELKKLKTLTKKSVAAEEKISDAIRKRKAVESERDEYKAKYYAEVKKASIAD
jgi:hypothetical protein